MDIYISRDKKCSGPYSVTTVRQSLEEGKLLPTDLAWHEGLEEWQPLGTLVFEETKRFSDLIQEEDISMAKDLPSPIAWAWARVLRDPDNISGDGSLSDEDSVYIRKTWRLIETGAVWIKFCAVISILEYIQSECRSAGNDELILKNIRRPSLGHWIKVSRDVAEILPHAQRFVPEFSDLSQNTAFLEAQEKLNRARNQYGHGPPPTGAKSRDIYADLFPTVKELLARVAFLAEYKLFSALPKDTSGNIPVLLLRGTDSKQCSGEALPSLNGSSVCLARADNECLELSPLLVNNVGGFADTEKPISESAVFFYNGWRGKHVQYIDYETPALCKAPNGDQFVDLQLVSPPQAISSDFEPETPAELPHESESSAELLQRGGNSNVEALAQLLLAQLPDEDLSDLLDDLRRGGAKGSDEGILCEHCLSNSPIELLTDNFSKQNLLRIARKTEVEIADDSDMDEIVKAILLHLDFDIVDDPKGLSQVMEHITKISADVEHTTDRDSVVGAVIPLSTEIERILHSLIVFYGKLFYGEKYRERFSSWSNEFGKSKLTFGTKCNLLRKMEKEILEDFDKSGRLRELFPDREREFVVGSEAIDSLAEIVPGRNDFSHFKDSMDGLSHSQCKTRVKDLITKTRDFLKHLEANKIFPQIITVYEYKQDRFGRKSVRCRDDGGNIIKIYTNKKIDPAKSYFLHSLTNPVSIHPLLIEYIPAE